MKRQIEIREYSGKQKQKKQLKKKNAAICMEEATSQEKIDRDKNTFWAKEYLERETDC